MRRMVMLAARRGTVQEWLEYSMLLAAITHAHNQLSKIGQHSPMRNQKLHRTTKSFSDGINQNTDIVARRGVEGS